jgi:hypothetical protein
MIEAACDGKLVTGRTTDREAHVVDTKVQLQQGATRVQKQAATAAAGMNSAAHAAAQGMHQAAQGMQQAAAGVNASLRASTLSARNWAAPRLENAADYTTSTAAPAVSDAVVKTVAPRVSAALRSTARQVSVTSPRRARFRSVLAWTAGAAAVLAAAGAAGTVLRRRYRAATAAESETDVTAYPAADSDAGTTGESAPAGEKDAAQPAPHPAPSAW